MLTVINNPYPWQTCFHEFLNIPADDREIVWIMDQIGGTGKTKLMKYYVKFHSAEFMSWSRTENIFYSCSQKT